MDENFEKERFLFTEAENAYFKAGETSRPEDWLQAALLAKQHRNALERARSSAERVQPNVESLIENLLQACVDYERAERFDAKYRRMDLDEAKQAIRAALAAPQPADTSGDLKPVAWRWKWREDRKWTLGLDDPCFADDAPVTVEPLYAELPSPAQGERND